jgi:hypothetical protein
MLLRNANDVELGITVHVNVYLRPGVSACVASHPCSAKHIGIVLAGTLSREII